MMREGWEYKKFDEVFNLQMGKTPNRKNPDYFGGKNVWISIRDLGDKEVLESNEHITDKAVSDTNIRKVKKGTVIMSFKLTVGKCGIAAKDLYTNEAIMAFNTKEGYDINSSFLYYYLQCYNWEGSNKAVMGITLNKATISKQHINIPPKSTQLAIVSELDKINELIRLKKEQLKDFDNLAQSLFYEIFGDPVENEKGWEVKKLNEIVSDNCSISYGIVQPGDGIENGVPVVRPVDMTGTFVYRQGLKNTTKEISDSYKRTILKGNEILMCVRGTTGLIAMASSELRGCNVTRGITPIECGKSCNKWFIYYQISNSSIQQYIAEYTRGIALKQINMKDVRDIPLCLPPLPLQHLFAHRIEQIEHQKAEVQKAITDLETLLASRMQYWFE